MRGLPAVVYSLTLICSSGLCLGQRAGVLSGMVTDPSGARVAFAKVHLTETDGKTETCVNADTDGAKAQCGEKRQETATDEAGRFSAAVVPGLYKVEVSVPGFETEMRSDIIVSAGGTVILNLRLRIQARSEQVTVPIDPSLNTNAADNKSALIFNAEQLAGLSDNTDILQKQLLAMAGGDGIHTPQFYIDGFTGGHFPPKNAIRQVRINDNPFTAQYDQLGFGRVEVFTKPGTGALHGHVSGSGNDAPWNGQNPYSPAEPPYHTLYVDGDLSGPLDKKTSFFAAGSYNDQANNAVVNTVLASQAVRTPQITSDFSVRLDRQFSSGNTTTARYDYNEIRLTNGGVGLLVLASEGYNNTTQTQTLQVSNTQLVSSRIVNETRFQYLRSRLEQTVADASPTVIVQGAFNGGGSSAGDRRNSQDRYEFQDYLTIERKDHFLRMGGRYRLLREADSSTANFNGQFIFPDLGSYEAAVAGTDRGASEYSVTTGNPSASLLTGDLGLYAEDEWRVSRNLTFDYGLRLETQSAIPDHLNWAPRLQVAWAIHQGASKPPLVVLRAGSGLFYDRFADSDILTSVRQNGISQRTYVIEDPPFYSSVPPPSALGAVAMPTTYSISPRMKVARTLTSEVSAEHGFGRHGMLSGGLFYGQGVHQYLSRNVNAPLPGTFNPADPTSGTRPLGGTGNQYEFSSDGTSSVLRGFVRGTLTVTSKIMVMANYTAPRRRGDTINADSFPTNEYDLRQDYGRSAGDMQQYFAGIFGELPGGIGMNLFVNGNTSPPFDITIGQDLNGDTQYNDRPAFATDLTRPSVVRTTYGNFDTAPIAGQTIIPVNYGHAPGFVSVQLQMGKDVKIGPREGHAAPGAKPSRPYTLSFEVEADNLLNHPNPAPPVGVLESPLFGKFLSLNNSFSGNPAANRTITLRTAFAF